MEQRFNLAELHPDTWKSLYALSAVISKYNLPGTLKHLIKVRASQINSCAYCINMHTKEALKAGETQQRLFLLNAWKETTLFSEEERAALAIAEEVTLIHQHGLTDETYRNALQYYSNEVIGEIILSTVLINSWNRIAVSSRTALD